MQYLEKFGRVPVAVRRQVPARAISRFSRSSNFVPETAEI
jgi:hypothetical protein